MTSDKKWWEKEPLRFECQADCFKCCTKPGIVYFDKASIENAAKILKISSELFKKEFLVCFNAIIIMIINITYNNPYYSSKIAEGQNSN